CGDRFASCFAIRARGLVRGARPSPPFARSARRASRPRACTRAAKPNPVRSTPSNPNREELELPRRLHSLELRCGLDLENDRAPLCSAFEPGLQPLSKLSRL